MQLNKSAFFAYEKLREMKKTERERDRERDREREKEREHKDERKREIKRKRKKEKREARIITSEKKIRIVNLKGIKSFELLVWNSLFKWLVRRKNVERKMFSESRKRFRVR